MSDRDEIAIRFGENLRRARKSFGLTQRALGDAADLDYSEIGNLEYGKRKPRIDTVIKLASSLNVPIDELVDGIDWIPEPPVEMPLGTWRVTPAQLREDEAEQGDSRVSEQ
jgi:transcriptional regulator with XRE-family HTH domain